MSFFVFSCDPVYHCLRFGHLPLVKKPLVIQRHLLVKEPYQESQVLILFAGPYSLITSQLLSRVLFFLYLKSSLSWNYRLSRHHLRVLAKPSLMRDERFPFCVSYFLSDPADSASEKFKSSRTSVLMTLMLLLLPRTYWSSWTCLCNLLSLQ